MLGQWVEIDAPQPCEPETRADALSAHAAPRAAQLVEALRVGDERAFLALVRAHHAALVRVALGYVRRADAAEEVAREAWQVFLESLPRLESQAVRLDLWLFRILVSCARARGRKQRRSPPPAGPHDDEGPVVAGERFVPAGEVWAGHWLAPPRMFVLADPAAHRETRALLTAAIDALPERQREVLTLRDVEGWSAADACAVLTLSHDKLRDLLHRARASVRAYLERRLAGSVVDD